MYLVCNFFFFFFAGWGPEAIHSTELYENNRVEQSHEATRARERGMRKFKSIRQAQRFLDAHAAVHNLFNLGRHLVRANIDLSSVLRDLLLSISW